MTPFAQYATTWTSKRYIDTSNNKLTTNPSLTVRHAHLWGCVTTSMVRLRWAWTIAGLLAFC